MLKSARRCRAKHISKSKCTKHLSFGPLLEVEMSKKCTPLWREAHFEVKSEKNLRGSEHFWTFRCRFAREGFVEFQKTMAGLGHLKRICKDAFSVAGAVQETEMILRDRCSTSYDRYHFFVAGAVV